MEVTLPPYYRSWSHSRGEGYPRSLIREVWIPGVHFSICPPHSQGQWKAQTPVESYDSPESPLEKTSIPLERYPVIFLCISKSSTNFPKILPALFLLGRIVL